MNRSGIRAAFQALLAKARNNPDYISGIAVAYISQALQILAQIFLVPLYIAQLGMRDFGTLMMFMTFVAGVNIVTTWSIGGITRSFSDAAAHERFDLLRTRYAAAKYVFLGFGAFFLFVSAALVLSVGHFVLSDSQHFDGTLILLVILGAAALILLTIDNMVEIAALMAMKRLVVVWLLQIESLAVFVVLVVAWLKSGGGIAGIFPCMAMGVIVSRLTVWIYWRQKQIGLRLKFLHNDVPGEARRLAAAFRDGYPAYSLIFAALQMDTLLVGFLGDPAMVGRYVLIWKIAEVGIFLLWRLSENLQPDLLRAFATGDHARAMRLFRHGVAAMALISLVAGIGYALLGQWAVGLWVGRDLVPDDALAYALAGAAVFWLGTARLSQIVAFTSGRLRGLIIVSGLELLVRLGLSVGLFPVVGYLAPLIAVSVAHALGCAWAYILIARPVVRGDR